MKVAVFGLGYVGCVSAACLAKEGNEVVGVDVNPSKVRMINDGVSPIVEANLDEVLRQVVKQPNGGSLVATVDAYRAVDEADVSLICVGTPSMDNGSLQLDYVRQCAREIGQALRARDGYHVVVARSTMLPGSMENTIIPELEYSSGKKRDVDFGVAVNPEFLRESTSIGDFYDPPFTVVGARDDRAIGVLRELYGFLDAPFEAMDLQSAEMVKYASNSFHALKVVFGNEIGAISKALNVDSHRVMEVFCKDKKLNLSSYYLKPGFAFGGSCLPKDLRALGYQARSMDVEVPMLESVIRSNEVHIKRAIDHVLRSGLKNIGILGLSFKAGTDDLRESPLVRLVEAMIGKGLTVQIFDRYVSLARLVGANKEFIENEIPHISGLMCDDLSEVVRDSDLIVIGNRDEEFGRILAASESRDKVVLDLVKVPEALGESMKSYEGICW